jgi:predicted HicB family RNase H-like nuclease
MGYLKYKGYKGSVEYSEEDNCLFGKVQGMSKDCITYEGNDVDELKADFEGAIDDYLESCKARGVEPCKPYSGTLNIRITPDIHSRIAMVAKEKGTTINAYIKSALENQLKHAEVF